MERRPLFVGRLRLLPLLCWLALGGLAGYKFGVASLPVCKPGSGFGPSQRRRCLWAPYPC